MTVHDPAGAGPVLFAYDGSPHARAAISRAGELWPPRTAVVTTAWAAFEDAAPAALLAMPAGVVRQAAADLDETQREAAETLAAEGAGLAAQAGFDARPLALKSPQQFFSALVDCAEELDAAAIVVGSRGRSPVAAAVLGSVSTGVLHHTRRPVLVVRADVP